MCCLAQSNLRVRSGMHGRGLCGTNPAMGTLVRYLTPGERLIYASRRHTVVLSNSFVVFLVSLVLGVVAAAQSHRWPAAHLGWVGAGIALLGSLFLAWRAGHWALTRY